jgi:HAD superfamily hydrolase (TIGR01509 family)
MISTFLFDFNGTLMRSPTWIALEIRDLPRAAFAHLAKEGHIPLLSEEQLALAESVFCEQREAADTLYRETSHVDDLAAMVRRLDLQAQVPQALIEETVATLHRRCIPTVELMPYIEDSLARLQGMGLRLGIISNAAYPPFLTWTLDHFGILDFFEDVIVSADVRTRKPGLDIFQIGLERMGLEAGQTAYVGDDFRKDVTASKQIGMRAVWFNPDVKTSPLGDGATADAIVRGHDEIPPLAAQWLAES